MEISWDFDPALTYYPTAILLIVLCIAAWSTTLFTLPGNWIVVALAAGFAWLFPEEAGRGISWWTVGVAGALAVVGEVIEFAASAAGAAKQGASKRAVVLSLVGAIGGSIAGVMVGAPVPILGSFVMALLGGAAGAFAGAYLGEMWKGRTEDERIAAGQGAFVGKIWGTLGKLACGAVAVAIIAADALF
ncbi:MAG: DUF456 domain-containing protein [Pirellulales bacterium]